MKKKITISDIAKVCAVGISSVSRTINEEPGVRPAVRKKILAYINEIGWNGSGMIRRLKNESKNKLVVLVISNLFVGDTAVPYEILDPLIQRCQQEGYDTIILPGNRRHSLEAVARIKPYAVIELFNYASLVDLHENIRQKGSRLICLYGETDDYSGVLCGTDFEAVGKAMVTRLRRAGHRAIGVFSGLGEKASFSGPEDVPTNRLRKIFAGIKKASPEFNPETDIVGDCYGACPTLAAILKSKKYTAWICTEWNNVVNIFKHAAQLGLKIPEDFSLLAILPKKSMDVFPVEVSRFHPDSEKLIEKVVALLNHPSFPEEDTYLLNYAHTPGETIRTVHAKRNNIDSGIYLTEESEK